MAGDSRLPLGILGSLQNRLAQCDRVFGQHDCLLPLSAVPSDYRIGEDYADQSIILKSDIKEIHEYGRRKESARLGIVVVHRNFLSWVATATSIAAASI